MDIHGLKWRFPSEDSVVPVAPLSAYLPVATSQTFSSPGSDRQIAACGRNARGLCSRDRLPEKPAPTRNVWALPADRQQSSAEVVMQRLLSYLDTELLAYRQQLE